MARRHFIAPTLVGLIIALGLVALSQVNSPVRAREDHGRLAVGTQPQGASKPAKPTVRQPALLPGQGTPPASAVFVWSAQRFAEGVSAGFVPGQTAATAVDVFRRDAENGRAYASRQPEAHLWLYTDEFRGIVKRPAWVLFFRNVEEVPISLPQNASPPPNGVYTGCWESYVVDATSGRGLSDTTVCPKSQ